MQIITYSITAITLAILNCGIWSIVFGQIISNLVHGCFLVIYSKWRPTILFNWRAAKEMFAFGKYMWLFSIFSAASRAIDRILIGRFWGAESLGYYHIAFNLCKMPANAFSLMINKVTFPAYSKLQEDITQLKTGFLKVLSSVAIIVIPLSLGLIATADVFVVTLYGSKWRPAIPLVQVLAIYGMSLSISAVTGPVFQALGKPSVLLYTSLIHHIILILSLFLLRNHGVIGICYAVLIPSIVSSTIAFYLIAKMLNMRINEMMSNIIKPGLSAGIMFLLVKLLQYGMNESISVHPTLSLFTSIIFGGVVYLFITNYLNRKSFKEFRVTLIEIIKS